MHCHDRFQIASPERTSTLWISARKSPCEHDTTSLPGKDRERKTRGYLDHDFAGAGACVVGRPIASSMPNAIFALILRQIQHSARRFTTTHRLLDYIYIKLFKPDILFYVHYPRLQADPRPRSKAACPRGPPGRADGNRASLKPAEEQLHKMLNDRHIQERSWDAEIRKDYGR